MAKVTLDTLESSKASSIISNINANNVTIAEAFENTLSRDGTSPNSMESTLDMNSNRIINLPAAASGTEPLRKAEFDAIIVASADVSLAAHILDADPHSVYLLKTTAAATTGAGLIGANDGASGAKFTTVQGFLDTFHNILDETSGTIIIGSVDSGSDLNLGASGAHDGDSNTGLGFNCFLNATSAYASTAIGFNALVYVTSGHSNTALGYQSGNGLTTGEMNTLLGVDAGLLSQVMKYTTVVGHHCLNVGVYTGNGSVIIGQQTARNLTTGDYINVIGRNAMANSPATGSKESEVFGGAAAIASSVDQSSVIGYDIAQQAGVITTSFIGGYRNNYKTANITNCVSLGAFGFFRSASVSMSGNVGLGADHGFQVAGDNNVFLGFRAAYSSSNVSVTGAVAIGPYAAFNDIHNGDLVIANSDAVAARLIWGNFDSKTLKLRADHLSLPDYVSAANDAAAAAAGLAIGEVYFNTGSSSLTIRIT